MEVPLKDYAKRNCRKCHGTGVSGRQVTVANKGKKSVQGSGQGRILICPCVMKNEKFIEAMKKVQDELNNKLRQINVKKETENG